MKEEKQSNDKIYLIKDGKQQMPVYDFIKAIAPDSSINPTHNSVLLKEHRLKLYNKAEQDFIEQRNINGVKSGAFEKNVLYYGWLKHELDIVGQWLSDTYPSGEKKKLKTSSANQVEILKYEQYVKTEMARIEKAVNDGSNGDSEESAQILMPLLNLTPNQLQYLYTELTKNEHFLPKKTNKRHFNYVFGGGVCPDDFVPLCWKRTKQALSELIISIVGKKSVPRPVQRVAAKLFVDREKESIGKLSNPGKDEVSADYGTVQTIGETIKTHSMQ